MQISDDRNAVEGPLARGCSVVSGGSGAPPTAITCAPSSYARVTVFAGDLADAARRGTRRR